MSGSRRKLRWQRQMFSLLELTVALALLGVLITAFLGAMKGVYRMKKKVTVENRAILVIDNTLERVAAHRNCSVKQLRDIFREEFQHSCLSQDPSVKTDIRLRNDEAVISVIKKNKSVVEVTVPCRQANKK